MKEAISQEKVSDSSHSYIPEGNGSTSSNSSLKSAAMLGLALSVGASGALVSQTEASAAVSAPTSSAATEAVSSNSSRPSNAATATDEAATPQQQIVGTHTIEAGESLWQIAQQHRVGLQELKRANALPPETSIRVGQTLQVPSSQTSSQAISSASSNSNTSLSKLVAGIPTKDSRQTEASSVQPVAIPQGEATRQVATQAPSLEMASPAISIEVADASSQEGTVSDTGSVVTALATPRSVTRYQVQPGDTLNTIATSFGITSAELIRTNALANPNVILVGDTLTVPAAATPIPAARKASPTPNAATPQQASSQRLAYLRSTVIRPEATQIIEDLREASAEEPVSVGGEPVTAKDLLGSNETITESADPSTASLLEDVQEIRTQAAAVSEVDTAETSVAEAAESEGTLLARARRSELRPGVAEGSARSINRPAVRSAESLPESSSADTDLLAAAPISPDAYIPAQRSGVPQVVSPDMPILPSADEYLPEAPEYFNGYIWPAQGTVTSGYGWRWGRMHRGVDVAGPVGTPIVAAGTGVVEQAGWNSGGYGNMVEIRHPDGSLTRYAHNNRLNVSAGQSVRQGQQIAEMGSTGYSTGPHLHFELHQSGSAVNPVAYLP